MDKNKYLEKQEIKNRRILLKMYNKQAYKIKQQLYKAYIEKRSTTYLTNLLGSINKEIDTLDKFFQEYAKRQTKETYLNGVKQADYGFKQITGFSELTTLSLAYNFGNAQREAINVLARETYKPLNKITKTMARDCREYLKRENFESSEKALKQLHKLVDSKTLRRMGIEGVSDVVVGNKTWQQGMKNIEKAFISQSDFKVPYYNKKGDVVRLVDIKEYAKMVARTTTAHIQREGTKDRILDTFDNEFDLVKIIGHSSFPNSPCIPFEGKILSLEGITKGYMTIDEAKAEGLFHPNCIHDFRCDNECMQIYREGRNKENGENKEVDKENQNDKNEKLDKKNEILKDKTTINKVDNEKAEIIKRAEAYGIDKIPFSSFKNPISETEIISRISGGDKTIGSCSSLALTYIANKYNNYNVLDFRGGNSTRFFAKTGTIAKISKLPGVESYIEKDYNDYVALKSLIKNVKNNKEYYLATGEHVAIIRKTNVGFEYLELQSENENGFKQLENKTFKKRFKCTKTHTLMGNKIEARSILIEAESLAKNKDFQELLQYINTNKESQQKGASGFAK